MALFRKQLDIDEVYGVSNEIIKSYLERKKVDEKFTESVKKDKAIIIYGSSKQGKTSLIQKHLNNKKYIKIECSPNTKLIDIYQSILRQNNIELKIENSVSNQVGSEGSITIKAKVQIPLTAEIEGGTEAKVSEGKEKTVRTKPVEYNLALPQSIIEILKAHRIDKYIVLENFHYLSEEEQTTFAYDLRTFQDNSIIFIILGIWRERNRLSQYNGDLQDRMIEIPVEPWSKEEFIKVLKNGEKYLRYSFRDIYDEIIEASFDSIGVLQELAKYSCHAGSSSINKRKKIYLNKEHLKSAVEEKLADYSTRHNKSLESFIDNTYGANKETLYSAGTQEDKRKFPLYIPNYFVKILLNSRFEEIINGLGRKKIHEDIKAIHYRPDDVRPGDMSNFLHKIISSQISKKISPPLFDYDGGAKKIKIIDSTLYFFLKHTNKTELIDDLDL